MLINVQCLSYAKFIHLCLKLLLSLIMLVSGASRSRKFLQLPNCQIIQSSNCQINTLSNYRIVKLTHYFNFTATNLQTSKQIPQPIHFSSIIK